MHKNETGNHFVSLRLLAAEPANQKAPKVLFTSVKYANRTYSNGDRTSHSDSCDCRNLPSVKFQL